MKTRLLAAALAFSALLSPGFAEAAHRAKAAAGPSYPMKADEFKALVEKRIDKVRDAIDKKLDRAGVTPERKKAIHKTIEETAKPIRAEVAKAVADGTVTQAEADKVKALTVQLRGHVREKLRAEKNPKKGEPHEPASGDKHDKRGDKHESTMGSKGATSGAGAKTGKPELSKAATSAPKGAKPSKPGPNKTVKAAPGKGTKTDRSKPVPTSGGATSV